MKIRKKCIGFGKKEGLCLNNTSGFEKVGRRNPLWCESCDQIRIPSITKQLEDLVNRVKGKT